MQNRKLAIKLTLDKGSFANGSKSTIIYGYSKNDGYYTNISATINLNFVTIFDSGTVTLSGLSDNVIKAIHRINYIPQDYYNYRDRISIYAGYNVDDDGLPPLCISGYIMQATADFNTRIRTLTIKFIRHGNVLIDPNTVNQFSATKGYYKTLDDLFSDLVNKMGYKYIGNNPQILDSKIHKIGNYDSILTSLCYDFGLRHTLSKDGKIMYVFKDNLQEVLPIITISKNNGMIGYPSATAGGVMVKTYYRNDLTLGQIIYIESDFLFDLNRVPICTLSYQLSNHEDMFFASMFISKYFSGYAVR